MGKWIRRIILVVLLAVFLFSTGSVVMILNQYRQINKNYEETAAQFTQVSPQGGATTAPGTAAPENPPQQESPQTETGELVELAPLVVDFAALQAVNPDVVGWIYCEGTPINYPVLHGATNNTYLRHLYDRTYSISGSIFVEASNRKSFEDANTIIYGHNMNYNNSMFGTLKEWSSQEFYEEHPVIWLLTPEQDYKIEVLGTYTTSAYSDTYTIFPDVGPELDEYLENKLAQSVIQTHGSPEPDARYVLLSTCAYVFDNARYVLHGKLVPVDSAGGVWQVN